MSAIGVCHCMLFELFQRIFPQNFASNKDKSHVKFLEVKPKAGQFSSLLFGTE